MHALIVHAHPEPESFNAAMRDTAATTLRELGYQVLLSDLYAQGFEAVASRHDFLRLHSPARLGYVHEQRHAAASRGYSPDILAEQDKLTLAEVVVFQFPLWWYACRPFSTGGPIVY